MATNKINFNNSTVTLKGVYYNGVKVEGCKGIKFNGNIVVMFVDYEFNWSDYTNTYNAVWTSSDTGVETNKMAQITGQNEFAICRSAWTLYTRQELAGTDAKLFNFNADGRLYIGDDDIAQNWNTLLQSYTKPITIASVHNKIPLYRMLTGLPLIYKNENATFAPTKILDANDNDDYDISYNSSNGEWKIVLADLSQIKDFNDIGISESQIAMEIHDTLGVTATVGGGYITITGAENWGEFEFLDALSNVYVPGFGPFLENNWTQLGEDELYRLTPNEYFVEQPYWKVKITSDIIIKNTWSDNFNSSCDFYILTGWGLKYVFDKTGDTTDNYYVQGDSNAEVNITYFDTSCFSGLQHPNILCGMNSAYSNFRPDIIFEYGNWAGIFNTDNYGDQTTLSMFPTDCPYSISNEPLPDLNLPEASTQWIAENNLQNTKVTCTIDENLEQDYEDGGEIIQGGIAYDVFDKYKIEYPTDFPSNTPLSPTNIVEYTLKLKMRTYPSYATGNGGTGAPASEKWYLNSYDPYNVGGYYPVKKTNATTVGNMYKTTVNYTEQ